MKQLFLLLLLCILIAPTGNAQKAKEKYSPETIKYFEDIAFGAEYNGEKKVIRKWNTPIHVFVLGEDIPVLSNEIDKIIKELKNISKNIQIKRVYDKEDSNFLVFFGAKEDYIALEPKVAPYNDLGFFWVYPNKKNELYKGSLYLDTNRMLANDTRLHFLREELTQALGLMQDSELYYDSIFYQKWSLTNQYSKIDKQVIEILHLPQIKCGMSVEEVRRVLEKI